MADDVSVKIGGKSQEEVALLITEKMLHFRGQSNDPDALLKTYREVLRVVRNPFNS